MRQNGPSKAKELVRGFSNSLLRFSFDFKPGIKTEEEIIALLETLLRDLETPAMTPGLAIFDKSSGDYYQYLRSKLTLVYWNVLAHSQRPDAGEWKQKIENIFKGKEEVRFGETGTPLFLPDNTLSHLKISRAEINTTGRVPSEINHLILTIYNNYLMNLLDSKTLPQLPGLHSPK